MFNGLCILSALNFFIYLGCTLSLNNPSSGPEGIGSALVAMASLFFSVVLTGFGLKQFYTELLLNSITRRTMMATLVAVLPVLAWLFSAAIRLKSRGP